MTAVLSTQQREEQRRRSGRWEGESEAEKAQKLLDSIAAAERAVEAQAAADEAYAEKLIEKKLNAKLDLEDGRVEAYLKARDKAALALDQALLSCAQSSELRLSVESAVGRARHLGLPVPIIDAKGLGRIGQEVQLASRFV